MTYSEHEQRLLDQQSGAALDRRAVSRELIRAHRLGLLAEQIAQAAQALEAAKAIAEELYRDVS